ncbi:MAG: protein-L-isoaspartate(D-aspartate) O-methyltransferase [Patescibacteria group bacterium]|nr:protein-L-isoaspartate(D-aspartate) O-methyltransferase [Patescibacteria group bacterium]
MSALIETLISQGHLRTPRIIEAFRRVPRFRFIPREGRSAEDLREQSEINAPLPIGFGQTISQPLTVAIMLEMLAPKRGDKILDVGSGSGWQTGLLAHIVGAKGKVYALEVIPELKEFGEKNVKALGLRNVQFILGDGWKGHPVAAPYGRIIVAAAAVNIPKALKAQLKVGGVMVIPVGSPYACTMTRLEKISEDDFEITEEPGFSFVPLVKVQKAKCKRQNHSLKRKSYGS